MRIQLNGEPFELPDNQSVASFSWVGNDRVMFSASRKVGAFA